ncbi:hypothetical protein ABB07_39565 (plasmid) [Streptomyces incarnatus]|uniref:Uncharacterized protein n=1 Tax=Streptomyces incarnatus TaxID=665007 RepID=A0ABM5TXN2_9ACTN|nr:hypothetical protein [Streptomyces incarnatus]AKJ15906.1 hypothetical protein ABB07_39565 [Streptomyces incarnatus]
MTTEAELLKSDDQRLDELFRKSPAGEIPKGPMEGLAVFPVAGRAGAWLLASLVNLTAWRGKVFSPDGYLSNRLTALDILSIVATVGPGPSRLDDQECIVIDYSHTSLVFGGVRDELRQVGPGLYLGLIWLAGRKIGWFTLRDPDNAESADDSSA